jgi:anti-sigma factor RsiW
MSRLSGSGQSSKTERVLHAYYDGALSSRARRRFESELERDPALARELEVLRELGTLAREVDAEAETPDLWDQIALRLPAEEARREEASVGGEGLEPSWLPGLRKLRGIGRGWAAWEVGGRRLLPVGAVAALALTAVLLTRFWATPEVGFAKGGVVRWVDSGGRSIMVVEDDGQTGATLIWLLDTATEGAGLGGTHETV